MRERDEGKKERERERESKGEVRRDGRRERERRTSVDVFLSLGAFLGRQINKDSKYSFYMIM